MIAHIPSLEQLVHELSRLPGIGTKTAQRLAYHLLRAPSENVENLRLALRSVKERVHECPGCYSYTEDDLCQFCANPSRADNVLCVVEDPGDIGRIESSGVFRGRYHVLHGAISPLDGITPQDLKIPALTEKVMNGLDGRGPRIDEVILALDADLEGDTTVLYLAKILTERKVKVTRIAHGVPIGSDIDFIDHRTLGRALENRIEL